MNDKTFTYIFLAVFTFLVFGLGLYLWSHFGGTEKSRNEMDVTKAKILQDSVNINQDRVKSYGNLDSMPTSQRLNINWAKMNFKNKRKSEDDNLENKKNIQKEQPRSVTTKRYVASQVFKKEGDKQVMTIRSETVKQESRHRSGFNDSPEEQNQEANKSSNSSSSINVVVHNEQTVASGSTVRMRATEEFMLNGIKIPRNTFITGKVTISGQRVNIHVPTIEYNGKLYDVNFNAYDRGDGLEGANVPDLMIHDAAKEELNNGINQAGQVTVTTPMVTIPVNTGRKKLQETKAQLSENYKLILRKNQ
jgi:hypothetical protein